MSQMTLTFDAVAETRPGMGCALEQVMAGLVERH